MNGYFSRMAKQSGLRFAAPAGGSPQAGEKPVAPLPGPLGIEETVLVSPPAPEVSGMSPGRKPAAAPEIPEATPVRGREQPNLEHPREALPPPSPSPGKLASSPPPPQKQAGWPTGKPVGEPRSVERTVIQDSRPAEARKQPDLATAAELETETVETGLTGRDDKQRFFTKTAEVLERGNPGAADIQDILLNEVREWAAATPTPKADEWDQHDAKPAANVTQQKPGREGPAINRPAGREERRAERAEAPDKSRLEEQNFNLSIGTINVVIEDTPETAQPPELKRQDQDRQNARRESPRSFSRLNRNYL